MLQRINKVFLLIGLCLTACVGSDQAVVNKPVRVKPTMVMPGHGPIIVEQEGMAPTPTPFLPGQVKADLTPGTGGGRPWGNYAGPTIWPPIDIPLPMGIIPQPPDHENILLLGDDQREGPTFRTDSIMLLILKPSEGSASLVSYPRDLYVYVPGWTMQRINMVMERGGFELLAVTFEYNFGIRPKYYAQVNLFTMGKIIDAIGGIDVNVPVPLKDVDYGIDVPAGVVHMDGVLAELYSQARYSTSDFDRTRRHQEVLQALFMKMISLDALTRVPELYNTYQSEVKTNIALDDLTRWLPLATQLSDFSRVQRYKIGETEVVPWTVPTSGSEVFLPERKAVLSIMQQAIGKP